MPTRRVHRYILQEITVPTGLSMLIFTFVLFMGRILRLAEMVISKGVPLAEIGRLFLFLMPTFLVLTIPLAFLLGILLGFGRMSADSEIIALKSSGFSLYGMLRPALLLALVACILTAILTLVAEPAGNTAFRREIFQIASSRASIGIQARIFNEDFDGLVIYANAIDDRTGRMDGVLISDERVGNTPSIIMARVGRIIADQNALTLDLRLENGTIHRRPQDQNQPDDYQIVGFTTYDVNLNLGQQLAEQKSRPKKVGDMSTAELLRARRDGSPVNYRQLTAELHHRFILPLAPILFALIGVPLGIQVQRSGRGGGFAMGLVVFLTYYLLLSFAETLAVEGGWPTVVLWLPNCLFLAGGLLLLVSTAREQRLPQLGSLLEGLGKPFRRQSKETG